MQSNPKSIRWGEPVLIMAALVWGASIPLTKALLNELGVPQVVFMRFGLAFCLLCPLAWRMRSQIQKAWLIPGIICGGLLGCVLLIATIGISHTTATRAAFLLSMFVVMVPFLAFVFFRRWPGMRSAVGAVLAISGSWFLTSMDSSQMIAFNNGDLLVLLSALVVASHMLAVERWGKVMPAFWLNYLQNGCACLFALVWCLVDGGMAFELSGAGWQKLSLLVVGCTIFTFWAQIWGQARTTANRAAVIFALEPVAAAGIAAVMLDESLGLWGLVGSGLILSGVLVVAWRSRAAKAARPLPAADD